MGTQRVATTRRIQIPHFNRVVHGSGGQELARVMKVTTPDRVRVFAERCGSLKPKAGVRSQNNCQDR